jgi:trimethylamine--corrinoid protein Co-methyltransferase
MDGSMACAVEQLVLGDEIIGMAKRFLRGVSFSPEQIARDLLYQVGPGGEFLSQNHTMEHFREELWRPSIFTRQPMEAWKQAGERDTLDRVCEKIRHILDTHRPQPLPQSLVEKLEMMKADGESELVTD